MNKVANCIFQVVALFGELLFERFQIVHLFSLFSSEMKHFDIDDIHSQPSGQTDRYDNQCIPGELYNYIK